MSTPKPYDFQSRALEALRRSFAAGNRRIILHSPTGSGKTTMAAMLISAAIAKGSRIGFLAHRKELIDQASRRLDAFDLDHGIIMAQHWRRRPDLPLQVASVQTLIRRQVPAWDLVVVDECHRTYSPSYLKVLSANPNAAVIGLTATPVRSDGKPLGTIYQDMVSAERITTLIKQGYLVRPRHYAPTEVNLDGVHVRAGDYAPEELAEVMSKVDLVGRVVGTWKRLAAERITVVFAVNRAHGRILHNEFVINGVAAEYLDGDTPKAEREGILSSAADGKTRVIVNVAVLTEGWDLPVCSCAVIARPTRSEGLYLQMAGRILRPAPDKTDCIILDHGNCARSFGLVDMDREWSLEDSAMVRAKCDAPSLTVCKQCFATYLSSLPACPECGHVPQRKPHEIVQAEGELGEITMSDFERQVREEYADLRRVARERGYKPGWAWHLIAARHGDSVAERYFPKRQLKPWVRQRLRQRGYSV